MARKSSVQGNQYTLESVFDEAAKENPDEVARLYLDLISIAAPRDKAHLYMDGFFASTAFQECNPRGKVELLHDVIGLLPEDRRIDVYTDKPLMRQVIDGQERGNNFFNEVTDLHALAVSFVDREGDGLADVRDVSKTAARAYRELDEGDQGAEAAAARKEFRRQVYEAFRGIDSINSHPSVGRAAVFLAREIGRGRYGQSETTVDAYNRRVADRKGVAPLAA